MRDHQDPVGLATATTNHSRTFRSRAFRAGSWLIVAQFTTQVLRFAGSLIMTRLLAPDVFGIMAIASTVQITIGFFCDVGLSQVVVQSARGADPVFLNTVWTFQILRGWLIWLVCAAVSSLLWGADHFDLIPSTLVYGNSSLPLVIVVTALSSVILGHQSMKSISHNRRLETKLLTFIEISSMIAGLCTSALFGYMTHSIWSFVLGTLMSSATTVILSHSWLPGARDRFGWEQEARKELLGFGKWAMLSSVATAFSMNGDRFLLGLWVSPTVLGNYSVAANLATMGEGIGNRLFMGLAFPALSEVGRHNPTRFPSVYLRMRWVADACFVWIGGFLFNAAEPIVSLLYDSRYAVAGQMLHLLSFSLLFNRYNIVGSAYLALGRPSYQTALNFIRLLSLIIAVPVLFHFYGVTGAIVGIAFHKAPTIVLILAIGQRHRLNDAKLEIAAIGFWILGYVSSLVFLEALNILKSHF